MNDESVQYQLENVRRQLERGLKDIEVEHRAYRENNDAELLAFIRNNDLILTRLQANEKVLFNRLRDERDKMRADIKSTTFELKAAIEEIKRHNRTIVFHQWALFVALSVVVVFFIQVFILGG